MIRSMHNNRWLICILILVCGCEGEPDAPPASEPVVGAGPEVVLPEDYSLSLEGYIRIGVPAHDRCWSSDDYVGAAIALTTIAEEDKRHLPRFESKNSGKLLKRIVADENLDFYRDKSIALDQRLMSVSRYNHIMKLYLVAGSEKATGGDELVDNDGSSTAYYVRDV